MSKTLIQLSHFLLKAGKFLNTNHAYVLDQLSHDFKLRTKVKKREAQFNAHSTHVMALTYVNA